MTAVALLPVKILTDREDSMKKISFGVQKELCAECSLALRRFIGKMDGVESIEVESGKIEISFDGSKISEKELFRISKDSMDKLGYKMLD